MTPCTFKEELSNEVIRRISRFVSLSQDEKDAITEYIHQNIEQPQFFTIDEKYLNDSKTNLFIEKVIDEVHHLY